MNITEFIEQEDWLKIKEFSEKMETPLLVINLDIIKKNYITLKENFSNADIFYAVKANPSKQVLELLRDLGSCFDVASVYELDKLLNLGVEPHRISFGNTIKKAAHIKYAYDKGIRLFVTDSESDLINISKFAPGSKVFIRLLVEGATSADWPLARKFGCSFDKVKHLLILTKSLNIEAYGLSFHVGSQQRDVYMWEYALLKVKEIFDWALEENIKLNMINLGGGFPSKYIYKAEELEVYAKNILVSLENHFNGYNPRIILEPGRSMVGDAGVIVSEVVLVSKKSHFEHNRWVYVDVGKFNGLIETMDECIKYPVYCEKQGEVDDVILAGPTCDSMDIMYENFLYQLPLSIRQGDRLYWLTTGAYTSSYSAVEFNGFPPLKVYCI